MIEWGIIQYNYSSVRSYLLCFFKLFRTIGLLELFFPHYRLIYTTVSIHVYQGVVTTTVHQ